MITNTEFIRSSLSSPTSAALITSAVNRRYLTGFNSSFGVVVVTKDRDYFITDGRYYERAAEAVAKLGFKVVLADEAKKQGIKALIERIFTVHKINSVMVESLSMTISEYRKYTKFFPKAEIDASGKLSDLIIKKRSIKTIEEIRKIESAQSVTEKAFDKILGKIGQGMTEKQVAALLNYYMMGFGADSIAFETIAASGVNSANPHISPTDKKLENGDFLILDFGAVVDGYCSDMTRTVVIGQPTDAMKRVYDAVRSANDDGLFAIRPNATGKIIDSVARTTLEAWGYEQYFSHSVGHGVGLEVHESPSLSSGEKSVSLREHMVITIEPGVYIPGKFGVRIENMAVVTADGCVNLTKTPKNLIKI